MDSVLRGRGVRVMRRLTARSKHRAAQALYFLQPFVPLTAAPTAAAGGGGDAGAGAGAGGMADLGQFKAYLYCLAEMQELRLPCSEDSLLDAMGLRVLDFRIVPAAGGGAAGAVGADPRALVRTWIHDEGVHSEVVELARDLLLCTQYQDLTIWYQLISHMVGRGFHRSLFQTLLVLQGSSLFADLCFGAMGAELLALLARVNSEATERTEQVRRPLHCPPTPALWFMLLKWKELQLSEFVVCCCMNTFSLIARVILLASQNIFVVCIVKLSFCAVLKYVSFLIGVKVTGIAQAGWQQQRRI
jgi:hypothetical protein